MEQFEIWERVAEWGLCKYQVSIITSCRARSSKKSVTVKKVWTKFISVLVVVKKITNAE